MEKICHNHTKKLRGHLDDVLVDDFAELELRGDVVVDIVDYSHLLEEGGLARLSRPE